MEDFNDLLNNLLQHNPIKKQILDFKYYNKTFMIRVEEKIFNQIHESNFILFNHKTSQYRIFTFWKKNKIMKYFKSADLSLIIYINKNNN